MKFLHKAASLGTALYKPDYQYHRF